MQLTDWGDYLEVTPYPNRTQGSLRDIPTVRYFPKLADGLTYALRPPNAQAMIKMWGTGYTYAALAPLPFWGEMVAMTFLQRLVREWLKEGESVQRERHTSAPPILLGDISAPGGTFTQGHRTHKHGTQIDLYYENNLWFNQTTICTSTSFDLDMNERLLRCILRAGAKKVLTEVQPILKSEEFKATRKVEQRAQHMDHFHAEV